MEQQERFISLLMLAVPTAAEAETAAVTFAFRNSQILSACYKLTRLPGRAGGRHD
jgi:hypothetical protein